MVAYQSLDIGKIQEKTGTIGLVQLVHLNNYQTVEKAVNDYRQLGITKIRTIISAAEWYAEGGRKWFDWLFSHLGKEFDILPGIPYTCRNVGRTSKKVLAAGSAEEYTRLIDEIISAYGRYFEYIELFYEPYTAAEYNHSEHDHSYTCYDIVGNAAKLCRERGKKVVLGGIKMVKAQGLQQIFQNDILQHVDVVGINGFPGVFDNNIESWEVQIDQVQEVLDSFGSPAKVWITEAGFSTWQKTEPMQLKEFINATRSGAERIYWYELKDKVREPADNDKDERNYHFGMKTLNDIPKLLYTLLASKGLKNIYSYEWMTEPVIGSKGNTDKHILITGGAGFVGVNLANRLLREGKKVLVFDNLSRTGVQNNLTWLKEKYSDNLQIMVADIRDRAAVKLAVENAEQVFHFAAQVAVTLSIENPFHDFEVNAQGTLILLEAVRNVPHQPPVVFTSTNKVYGDLDDLGIVMNGTRYHPESTSYRLQGVNETRNLDFHSPYGCTKGLADQYMLDYARTFGLKTVVFRMSCIFGPHQFGTEDQGWVAHFLIQALKGKPITLYGDGKQVRDILFVEDLVDGFMKAMENINKISGQAFNVGGGVNNTVSLLELCSLIGDIAGKQPEVRFDDWRPSDQKYYVSDFTKFSSATGWIPQVGAKEGVARLYHWLQENAGVSPAKKINKKLKVTNPV